MPAALRVLGFLHAGGILVTLRSDGIRSGQCSMCAVVDPIHDESPLVAYPADALHEPEVILAGVINPNTDTATDGGAFHVPDVARCISITWNDPFYENENDIIAAFDFNLNDLRDIYAFQETGSWFNLIASILLGLFVSFGMEGGWVWWILLSFPLFGSILLIAEAQEELYMLGRRHVAVAQCGVYLDETEEPGSSTLAKRTVVKFESIVSCREVQDMDCINPRYRVVIMTNEPTTARKGECRACFALCYWSFEWASVCGLGVCHDGSSQVSFDKNWT
jgi:hypothetical protein